MEIGKIDSITVFILESLHKEDWRTGANLRDDLRQYQYDNIDFPLNYEYYVIDDETELRTMLSAIEQVTSSTNSIPIIQLECHGNVDGIELSSYQRISWIDFFDLIRPINIASLNLLLLNLSMCYSESIIRSIDPRKRAPFRAMAGPIGKAYPIPLQSSWSDFYKKYCDSLLKQENNEDMGICAIAQSCNLIYYEQEFIFDVHYDTPNLLPELFEQWTNEELAKMYNEEGPLMLDVAMYKKWKANKLKKMYDSYKAFYCFYDVREKQEKAYKQLLGSE